MTTINDQIAVISAFQKSFSPSDTNVKLTDVLVKAVVKQMGGEEGFIKSFNRASKTEVSGIIEGFFYSSERVRFYQANKQAILAFYEELARTSGSNSAIEHVSEAVGNDFYSSNDIAMALYGIADKGGVLTAPCIQYCGQVVYFLVEAVLVAYGKFEQQVDLAKTA